jgi:ribosomal protein L11 methyltransferase
VDTPDTDTELRFPFVLVDVDAETMDIAASDLFDLGAQGVEERDGTTLVKGRMFEKDGSLRSGTGAQPSSVTLVASFETQADAEAAVLAMPASMNPEVEQIIGDLWRDAWKIHFKPFALCEGLVVRPPWETYEAKPGERVLELEPGRAFGTGLHETTSLVATILSSRAMALTSQRVLDVGTGSGILSLVALMFGAQSARATDNDPDVIDVVNENAERNGLRARVFADTAELAEITEAFPWVLANIEARVLIPMAEAIKARTQSGGTIVLSGILKFQKEEVLSAYADCTLLSAPERGEWIALEFRKS